MERNTKNWFHDKH